jgi:hypothetical protein
VRSSPFVFEMFLTRKSDALVFRLIPGSTQCRRSLWKQTRTATSTFPSRHLLHCIFGISQELFLMPVGLTGRLNIQAMSERWSEWFAEIGLSQNVNPRTTKTAGMLGLESSLRSQGRPRRQKIRISPFSSQTARTTFSPLEPGPCLYKTG